MNPTSAMQTVGASTPGAGLQALENPPEQAPSLATRQGARSVRLPDHRDGGCPLQLTRKMIQQLIGSRAISGMRIT